MTRVEQLLHDADLASFAVDFDSFLKSNELLRKELGSENQSVWRKKSLPVILRLKDVNDGKMFYTARAIEKWLPNVTANIERFKTLI
ncbi:MAG: hypothetical protein V1811_02135 [Candidatus Micrarchaeota archaeon]